MAEGRDELRAADVDRQFVADRLKTALDEGRLSLQEYDDRLKDTYAARTYGDLDRLMADLPGPDRSPLVPAPPHLGAHLGARPPAQPGLGMPPQRRPRWIGPAWGSWLTVALIVNAIWFVTALTGDGASSYWPIWVMLPWGAVLLAGTINAGTRRDYRDYRDARRDERRRRRRDRRGY